MKVAVIPARGGSTRLKDKNIYPLMGKPLIRWSLEEIIASKQFDEVVVSTDSNEIWKAVEDLPVKRHLRPDKYATEKSTVLDAMINLMETDYSNSEVFAYFLPTCPFIKSWQIVCGVQTLGMEEVDSVISMTEMETVQLACLKSGYNDVVPVFDNLTSGLTNSKFIKKYYKPSGGFYMAKTDYLMEHKNYFAGNTRGVFCPKEDSVDINTLADIKYAEAILVQNMYQS